MNRPHRLSRSIVRRDSREAMVAAARVAVLLAVAFAFVWQAFVTQSHVHFDWKPAPVTRAAKADLLTYAGWPVIEKAQPSCAICQDAAASDHHLPGSPATIEATPARIYTLYLVAAQIARVGHIAPGWNSRAPPKR